MKLNELKILLALNGNKRLPELEEEIFSNEKFSFLYLNKVTRGVWTFDYGWDTFSHITDCPEVIYVHAHEILKSRWIAAEHIIATDPYHAYYYAQDVINGRWTQDTEAGRKAEAAIKRDAVMWNYYVGLVSDTSDNIVL